MSVVVVTYNHARFVSEALEGVLNQRTDFPVEVLISDDASTDGTIGIVERYVAANPDQVQLLLSARNLNTNAVTTRAIQAARGRYIAIMDGDDLWTSRDKLDRQYRFMESHPESAVCFHDVSVIDADGRVIEKRFVDPIVEADTGWEGILGGNYVPGSAQMFRRDVLQALPEWVLGAPFCDWALLIAAARHGRISYLPAVMGAYRKHAAGIWSGLDEIQRIAKLVEFYDYLDPHIWPEWRQRLRYGRACWRVNLINLLDRLGRSAEAGYALADGASCGDFGSSEQYARLSISTEPDEAKISVQVVAHERQDGNPTTIGHVDEVAWSDQGRIVTVVGWGPFASSEGGARLVVESEDPIKRAVALRLRRDDVAKELGPSLAWSGFWLRIDRGEAGHGPIRVLGIGSDDKTHLIGDIGLQR